MMMKVWWGFRQLRDTGVTGLATEQEVVTALLLWLWVRFGIDREVFQSWGEATVTRLFYVDFCQKCPLILIAIVWDKSNRKNFNCLIKLHSNSPPSSLRDKLARDVFLSWTIIGACHGYLGIEHGAGGRYKVWLGDTDRMQVQSLFESWVGA